MIVTDNSAEIGSAPGTGRNGASCSVKTDGFVLRHIGPGAEDTRQMLAALSLPDLDTLIDRAVPSAIPGPSAQLSRACSLAMSGWRLMSAGL